MRIFHITIPKGWHDSQNKSDIRFDMVSERRTVNASPSGLLNHTSLSTIVAPLLGLSGGIFGVKIRG